LNDDIDPWEAKNRSTGWVNNDHGSSSKWGVRKKEGNKMIECIDVDMTGDDNTNSTQPTYASGFDSNPVYPTTVNYAAMPRDDINSTVMKRIDPPRVVAAFNNTTQHGSLQPVDCRFQYKSIQKSTSNHDSDMIQQIQMKTRAIFQESLENLEKAKKLEDEQRIKELKIQWPSMRTENKYGDTFSLKECERYVKNKKYQKNCKEKRSQLEKERRSAISYTIDYNRKRSNDSIHQSGNRVYSRQYEINSARKEGRTCSMSNEEKRYHKIMEEKIYKEAENEASNEKKLKLEEAH
jgi:hypothetical protein